MKKKLIRILIEVLIIVIIVFGFIVVNEGVTKKNKTSFIFVEDDKAYAHQIEESYIEGEDFIIKGWFFELLKVYNEERETFKNKGMGVLLYDLNDNTAIELIEDSETSEKKYHGKMTQISQNKRSDINSYFKCEYDYSDCGFTARIPKNELDLENGEYEIIIKPDYEGKIGIHSYAFLDKGKLVYTNPKEKMVLDVAGTSLEQIVNDGVCLVSCPDYHICVYQYENRLFWIADESYAFNNDGSTYIQYQLDTTQFDRLPGERTSNGWYWDNIGDYFEANEITDIMDCGKYRVSVRDIPEGYAITRAETGFYDGDWVWRGKFRPIGMS